MTVTEKVFQGEFPWKCDWMGEGNCRWNGQKVFCEVVLFELRPE